MKLKLITLAVAAAASVGFASSAYAGLANQGYVGLRGGWAFTNWSDKSVTENGTKFAIDGKKKSGFGYGIYAGYNITDWFGIEAGFNNFDNFSMKASRGDEVHKVKYNVYGPELAARLAWTFDQNGSDVYFRAGAAWLTTSPDDGEGDGYHDRHRVAPLVGVGVNYAFTRNFAVRAGFDYYFNAVEANYMDKISGNNSKIDAKADIGMLFIGVQYQFGGPAVAPAPVTQQVTRTHSLDASTLFPFDGYQLSQAGRDTIANVLTTVQNDRITNAAYEVHGYTDRIGSAAYNQKLSERRADSVANEFRAQGVTEDQLRVVQGHGKANPVTGNTCNGLRGQKLRDCLAPDRRVEVVVTGDQLVEQTK
ncbi:MAG: outer membrane beta-barrel protein [Succinivibrionaceae bacterium]|nr:outer membrane beta-barrel protein [Succinivibrionaceae bacterium]